MQSAGHSDAGYLHENNAQNRADGHFYLSDKSQHPPNNGPVLIIFQIIKSVMLLSVEAELGALFINVREAVYIRQILHAMGHEQE